MVHKQIHSVFKFPRKKLQKKCLKSPLTGGNSDEKRLRDTATGLRSTCVQVKGKKEGGEGSLTS